MNIAIIQNSFIHGGRLRWLSSLISFLNDQSIIPDVISYNIKFNAQDIHKSFGRKIKYNSYELNRPLIPLTNELEIIHFNFHIRSKVKNYDWVINSSNSWIGLRTFNNIIHYIHFPRKFRLWHDIHYNGSQLRKQKWYRPTHDLVMRATYSALDRVAPRHVVANSKYTAKAIAQFWNNPHCDVIYPPLNENIKIIRKESWLARQPYNYVLLGRFCEEKGQLQLLKLLKDFPGKVHMIGFADTKGDYFKDCMKITKKRDNVFLHPNAPIEELNKILSTAQYYIHTTVNEPFGLSIIEAISHGLLPIIHASGGAQEIVEEPLLQYNSLEMLPETLNKIQYLSDDFKFKLLCNLQNRCNTVFGKKIFDAKWKKILFEAH